MKKSLFSNLKNLKVMLINKPGTGINSGNLNKSVSQNTVNNFVKLHSIPDCIFQNPEFKYVSEIFNNGELIGTWHKWQMYESQVRNGNCLTYRGAGYLAKNNTKSQVPDVVAKYEFNIKSNISQEKPAEINSVEFRFNIADENLIDKLVSYSKLIKFEIFSKPDIFKSDNKDTHLNLNKIVKVIEKTSGHNHFVMYYDELGNRLQPLRNEWYAIELVGTSRPKSVDIIENLITAWQNFNQDTSKISKSQTVEFNPLN